MVDNLAVSLVQQDNRLVVQLVVAEDTLVALEVDWHSKMQVVLPEDGYLSPS